MFLEINVYYLISEVVLKVDLVFKMCQESGVIHCLSNTKQTQQLQIPLPREKNLKHQNQGSLLNQNTLTEN